MESDNTAFSKAVQTQRLNQTEGKGLLPPTGRYKYNRSGLVRMTLVEQGGKEQFGNEDLTAGRGCQGPPGANRAATNNARVTVMPDGSGEFTQAGAESSRPVVLNL